MLLMSLPVKQFYKNLSYHLTGYVSQNLVSCCKIVVTTNPSKWGVRALHQWICSQLSVCAVSV